MGTFTAAELSDIYNKALETYLDRGTVWKQDVANKPMLRVLNQKAGKFVGGRERVSFLVGSGYGGQALQGYTGDDQVTYYNPVGSQRAYYVWKEHHIGLGVNHTELKTDGIDISEGDTLTGGRDMSGREAQALANIIDEKVEKLGNDYAYSLDRLVHGDGTTDTKAIAGIQSLILANPFTGVVGGINAAVSNNWWWRNDACTAAAAGSGGLGAITSSTSNGGALIEALDKAKRRRSKYAQGTTDPRYFAGSDFIDAYKKELRANGYYTMTGWGGGDKVGDGSMGDPEHGGVPIVWDPTLDDLGLNKRCYVLDMSRTGVQLLYMDGQRMKKWNPIRPYDRYVSYQAITMTGVMVVKQRNTSGVYDIT